MARLPTIDEALELVLGRVQQLEAEDVPIGSADGRVTRDAARAAVDLPPFDSSAMDGFAVRAADTPGDLRVAGESSAGSPSTAELGPGEAIRISTGAVVPTGADAVVPVERTQGDVTVERVEPGEHVRPRGGDARAGDVVVEAGSRLAPAQLGALAAVGLDSVRCARRPRVAVLVTGSELRRPGETLAPGQIYESNSVLLAAQLRSVGAIPELVAQVEDDPAKTREAVERALGLDMLITSGGVSVGEHDLVRGALRDLGVEEVFWRVAVKPGKPVAFGMRGSTLVFGLPGNPVSSLVGFELLVRPALLALQGAREPRPQFLPGALARALPRSEARDELVRARHENGVLEPVAGQESHMIARAAGANALVFVPRGDGVLAQGAAVSWLPL